jgi:hypothetical protein
VNKHRIALAMLTLSCLTEQELEHLLVNIDTARVIAMDFNGAGLHDIEDEDDVNAVVDEMHADLDELLGNVN